MGSVAFIGAMWLALRDMGELWLCYIATVAGITFMDELLQSLICVWSPWMLVLWGTMDTTVRLWGHYCTSDRGGTYIAIIEVM